MTSQQEATASNETQLLSGSSDTVPTLPVAVKDAKATRELMFTLRHFHLGDPGASTKLEPVDESCLPALLAPFRDTSKLRYDYPLFLFPPEAGDGDQGPAELACPLSQWLRDAVDSFAPSGDKARILRDNLPWLEHHLRQTLANEEEPSDAGPLITSAGEALQKHLKLGDDNRDRLADDLASLVAAIPAGSQLLGFGRYAAIHLLIHSIRSRVLPRRMRFQAQIDKCIKGLNELLKIEWSKSDESIEPRMARDSVGVEGSRFDPAALSVVMDHSRGTHEMTPKRRARIEHALEVLGAWKADPVMVRFVHLDKLADPWLEKTSAFEAVSDPDPCARATKIFDKQANKLAEVYSAVRIAQLEIDRIYDSVIHDPWFANFSWEGFSHDELLMVPAVIALESADRVAGEGLKSFSRLLSSGRPVQILIRVRPSFNPGALPGEDQFQSYRTELGYLGISHRQAVIAQSSAARHQHLLHCFLDGLDATRTSLHIINTGLRPPSNLVPLNAWLVAGAGIESRAHPFFRINPEAGDTAAARMDFSENPQPDADWPMHPFQYRDENANTVDVELGFTFADYALLIPEMQDHFRVIPPGCDSDALICMDAYLAMGPEEANRMVPFVWAVDGNSLLHRLVVSRELAHACRDRLNYWRALQEMSGVRNRYVELAIERTRKEEREQAAAERQRLEAEHGDEVERVRRETASEAMQRLTDILLGMDLTAGAPSGFKPTARTQPAPSQAEAEAAEEPAAAAPAEEEEELSFDEPWIDTPLCTSCNDCLAINALLFLYNEEKQAYLGDPKVGTFAQLVEAAELCPAKCIHPGKPWDPNEAGLDDLVARAAPFNQ